MILRAACTALALAALSAAAPAFAAQPVEGKGWGVCVAEGPDATNYVSDFFAGDGAKKHDYETAFAAQLGESRHIRLEDGAQCEVYADRAAAEQGLLVLLSVNGGANAAQVKTGWKPKA